MENGLNKIKIKNYQSIKNLELNLGDITVITGKSDSGKSALFRAIKAVVSNQSGENYITQGEKECEVDLDEVRWIQSKTMNGYEIGDRKWEKCGRGVPEEVSAELNMTEFEFGKDIKEFLNFSGQLDRAFIVQGNPADNAKVIGSISNVHVVYNALREAEKDTKGIKKRMNIVQDQFEESTEQLEKDEKEFKKTDRQYKSLKEIFIKAQLIDDQLEALSDLKGKFVKVISEIGTCAVAVKKYEGIDFSMYLSKIDEIEKVKGILTEYEGLKAEIAPLEAETARLKGFDVKKGLMLLKECESLAQAKNEAQTIMTYIDKVKGAIEKVEEELVGINEVGVELEAMKSEINACETCGALQEHWNL